MYNSKYNNEHEEDTMEEDEEESVDSLDNDEVPRCIERAIDEVLENHPKPMPIKELAKMVMHRLFYYFSIKEELDSDRTFSDAVTEKAQSLHEKLGGHIKSALRQALGSQKHFILGEIERHVEKMDDDDGSEPESETDDVDDDQSLAEESSLL